MTQSGRWGTTQLFTDRAATSSVMTKLIQATKGYKIFVVCSVVFVFLYTALALWLWSDGLMPLYVALISVVVFLSLIRRFIVTTRLPAVEVRENELIIYGWFGGKKLINLSAPIDMASNGSGIVLKRGRSGAAIGRYVIGKEQFDEITRLLSESTRNTGR